MTYPLSTPRLLIGPLNEADIDAFVAYRQDADVARWQSWDPSYSRDDAYALVSDQPTGDLPASGGWLQLALRSPDGSKLYGDVAVHHVGDQPDTFELGVTLARASGTRRGW